MRSMPQQHWPELYSRAIHQHVDRPIEIGVVHDVTRILAAEFEAQRRECSSRRAFDGAAAVDGAGEVDEVEALGGDQRLGGRVIEEDVLEQVLPAPRPPSKARTRRSPASSVCVACLMITALPAIRAGATVLIAVR